MQTQRFVSLFSGAGGLDLGFEQAGWNCVYASDIDPDAVECMASNMKRGHFVERADVRELTGTDILSRSGGLQRGDIPLMLGGPPCQSWSSAGHQLGLEDARGRLFSDFVRLANEVDARWLVFENVRGLLAARGPDGEPGSALELIRQSLLNAGFQTTVKLLNAADYGVPQRRVRLFIIGFRAGDAPAFPEPTHSKTPEVDDRTPWVKLRECLGSIVPVSDQELIFPNEKLGRELSKLPDGTGVKSPGKKERTRPGGHWGYKQGAFIADPELPSRTITASGQQDWIRDPQHGLRRLSPRECAAIQTFPANWIWPEKRSAAYRLVGNAVPPLLASRVGEQLQKHIAGEVEVSSAETSTLLPLSRELSAAIAYTKKEERSNGASRKSAPAKKRVRIAV